MKRSATLLFAVITGVAIFSGCHKRGNGNPYTMNAVINGVAFAGSNCVASASSSALNITGGNFTGSSTTSLYPNIVLYISNYTGIGTYSLMDTAGILSSGAVDSSAAISASASMFGVEAITSIYGTVTITATTPNITGTFSFTASDSTKVAGGTFTAKAP